MCHLILFVDSIRDVNIGITTRKEYKLHARVQNYKCSICGCVVIRYLANGRRSNRILRQIDDGVLWSLAK